MSCGKHELHEYVYVNKIRGGGSVYILTCVRTELSGVEEGLKILEELRSRNGVTMAQVVRDDIVAGVRHVEAAVFHSIEAFTRGSNIAAKPSIELLLRLTGTRQIRDALAVGGITGPCTAWIIAVWTGDTRPLDELKALSARRGLKLRRLDEERPSPEEIARRLGISRGELEGVQGSLHERVEKIAIMRAALLHIA